MANKGRSVILSAFFQMQRTWFFFVILGGVFLFLYLFVYAFQTTVNIEQPIEDGDVRYAPFADPLAVTDKPGLNALPLNQPHLSYLELENWVTIMVSDSLSFDAVTYYSTLAKMRREYFTTEAYEEYQTTLQDYGIVKYLSQSGYDQAIVRGFRTEVLLEDIPALDNEGVVGGTYKWLYEVPIEINYVNPKLDQSKLPLKQRAFLRLQISRVLDSKDPLAVRVDEWEFTPRRR